MTTVFVALSIILGCYTAALVIGAIITTILSIAVTFYTVWMAMFCLVIVALIGAFVEEFIRQGRRRNENQ